MRIELHDEVPAPRFEDNLWGELARIYDQESTDSAAPPIHPQRKPGRRVVLAGAGSMAAAAVLIAVTVTTRRDDNPQLDLAARIIAATQTAMADSVVHEITDWADPPQPVDAELWSDETTGRFRFVSYGETGQLSLDVGPTAPDPTSGEPEVRAVDYCFEEYTVDPMFESARRQSWSQLIVEALESGEMYQDGTEVVDGRELIRVRETSTDYGRWLIDPDTYRPVRLVGEVGDGNDMAYVTTFDYLPRTPENLANLTTVVPDNFDYVDELSRTDDYIPGCS